MKVPYYVIVLLVAAGVVFWWYVGYRTLPTASPVGSPVQVVTPAGEAEEPIGTPNEVIRRYQTELRKHQTLKSLLQFSGCAVSPPVIGMQAGTTLMLENRDGMERKITVGTQTFDILPFDFVIVPMEKTGTFEVTCGGKSTAFVQVVP